MRKTRNLSAGLFGLIILLLVGLNIYVYTDLREAAVRHETDEVERQVQIQARDIESSLQAIRFALERIALQAELAAGHGPAVHLVLKQAETVLPYVRALSIVSKDGGLEYSSRSFPSPRLSLRDRPNIAHHIHNPESSFFFGDISRNITDGRWQISMSLAVRRADGGLRCIVAAVIDPHAYADAFRLSTAAEDSVTLLDSEFRLIARSPWRDDDIGRPLAHAQSYQQFAATGAARHSGVFTNSFTGEVRIGAVQRLFDDRLIVSTSRPLEMALGNWRSLAIIVSAISAAVVLLGICIAIAAMRLIAARHREAKKLAQLNTDLQEQTARAERAAAVKSDFLATMSHEIRTPMNGVLGMAQAMERLTLDAQARDYLGIIRESSESLLNVINDILDFSRLEAGKLKIEPVDVRLAPLLDALEALFAPACEQKKLAFRIQAAPDAPALIETDHMRLRQILMNLIGNAVKFTAAGHVLVWMRAAQLADGRAAVRFEIEDTGIGIATDAQRHLFERFSQEDASISRKFGGTGLGLAICRRLCDLLGGRIGCRSRKGAGSVFWVELPVLADSEIEPVALPEPPPAAPGGRLRILAVDDNPVNRRIIGALLQPFQHQLSFATGGTEALRLVEQQVFDVVLLDIHMPEMDGFETLRRLRRLPYGRHMRVLALTADVVPEATVRYNDAGFDDVVAKPVVLEALLAALAPRRWAAMTG